MVVTDTTWMSFTSGDVALTSWHMVLRTVGLDILLSILEAHFLRILFIIIGRGRLKVASVRVFCANLRAGLNRRLGSLTHRDLICEGRGNGCSSAAL